MSLATGTRIGAYEILAPIGAGGMGEVYRARDLKLQRDIAIKLLPAAAANPNAVERFQREARAVAALNHPNIVTIYGVEEADGRPFIAMELVDGQTIAETILSHGLPLERVLECAIPLADALSAAHAMGITHRDLKPSNVMLTNDRRVKILDFGLAKLREDCVPAEASTVARGLTGEGQIVGTVAYMSPEQACGTPLDHRTDVFSFGVMLYEMAAGRRPFVGDSAVAVLAAILREQPTPLADIQPDLPREFSRIVRHALAKDPEQRYQTAKDLRNDLQALKNDLASGELTAAAPVTKRRWSLAVALAAAATTAVVMSIGAYVVMHGRPWLSVSPAETIALSRLTSSGQASLAAISPDGKYVVHVVSHDGSSLWMRQTATGSNVQILAPGPNRYVGLTFTPDGNYVYFTREDGRLTYSVYRIATLGGQPPQPILRNVDSAVAISPDGLRIAFIRCLCASGQTVVMVAGSDGSNPVELARHDLATGFPIYASVAWSSDSRRLVVPLGGFTAVGGTEEALLEIIDVASKTERPITTRHWHSVAGLAWLPGGDIVISATESGKPNYQLWSVSQGDGSLRRLTNDLNSYEGVSAAAAAASIVTVQGDQSSTLSVSEPGSLASLKPITTGSGRYDGQLGLTWTPDGKLVYSSAATGQRHLWMSEADGSQARQITSSSAIEERPSVCPDGHTVIFTESVAGRRGLSRLDVTTGHVTPLTNDPTDSVPQCLSDGHTVVFSRTTASGPSVHRMALDGTGISLAPLKPIVADAVSPDGRFVIGFGKIEANRPWVVAVLPIDGTGPERGFDIISLPVMLRFTPSGDALTFLESRQGPQALWTQSLAGGAPTLLLDMHGEQIFDFAWSRDGRLVVAHGPIATDVVMMSGIR